MGKPAAGPLSVCTAGDHIVDGFPFPHKEDFVVEFEEIETASECSWPV